MNKIILTLLVVTTFCFTAYAQNEKRMQTLNEVLIVYFSATHTTAKVAHMIANITGGTLYEITPQRIYTSEDLDWNNKMSRSSIEMKNPAARPTLHGTKLNISGYNVIFIGYPIWWNQAPRIVNTFIESYSLEGKILVPFATSGGSGIDNSVKETPIRDKIAISCMLRQIHESSSHAIRHGLYIKNRKRLFCP